MIQIRRILYIIGIKWDNITIAWVNSTAILKVNNKPSSWLIQHLQTKTEKKTVACNFLRVAWD